MSTRKLQAIPEVGFPLRALVVRSPPVCVSSSLPPLPIAVFLCKTFIPSKAIMFQIILPLLGFCLRLAFHRYTVRISPTIPTGTPDAVTRHPLL